MWCYSYPYFHESLKVEVDSVPERELATRCSSYQSPSIWSPLLGGRKDTHTLTEILTDAGLYNGMNGSPVQKNRQDYQLLATRVRLTAETRDG